MSETSALSSVEVEFLQPYLPVDRTTATNRVTEDGAAQEKSDRGPIQRPFVTLTYACSLDSMISLGPGLRTTLSGPETKSMTHFLRLHHDAILVGVGTAIADDPSLNCRYPGGNFDSQPQPIVLDSRLRWDVANAKVRQLALDSKGKTLWHFHNVSIASDLASMVGCERVYLHDNDASCTTPAAQTDTTGATEKLDWSSIFKVLSERGIRSVMIEGGATIINDLLSCPDLVDSVIITVAPTFLGQGGTFVSPNSRTEKGHRINAAHLAQAAWRQFGQDVVLCGKLDR